MDAEARERLAEHRIDTLTETTLRDESYFVRSAETFRRAGFRIEAATMAVPEAQSRLGILDRYEAQVRASGVSIWSGTTAGPAGSG